MYCTLPNIQLKQEKFKAKFTVNISSASALFTCDLKELLPTTL